MPGFFWPWMALCCEGQEVREQRLSGCPYSAKDTTAGMQEVERIRRQSRGSPKAVLLRYLKLFNLDLDKCSDRS